MICHKTPASQYAHTFTCVLSSCLGQLVNHYADSTILVAYQNKTYTMFAKRIRIIEEWMSHCKLSIKLKKDIRSFYKLKWDKLYGYTDEKILLSLPECLSTDLRFSLYSGMSESGLFPPEEQGAFLGIIRKCKLLMFSAGTYVISKGEIGTEMFFILEGTVNITSDATFLKELREGSIFGELLPQVQSSQWFDPPPKNPQKS